MYEYKATVTNVVDGDTIDGIVDLGFRITLKQRFRLLGIDTPEIFGTDKERGKIIREFVSDLLLNKNVTIKTEKGDAFGRWLATVILEDGTNVNELLLEKGYAILYIR